MTFSNRLRALKSVLTLRLLLVWALCMTACPGQAQQQKTMVTVQRNVYWNRATEHFGKAHDDLTVVRAFLKSHEQEPVLNDFDAKTFISIDDALEELKAAEKELKNLRDEISFRENQEHAQR